MFRFVVTGEFTQGLAAPLNQRHTAATRIEQLCVTAVAAGDDQHLGAVVQHLGAVVQQAAAVQTAPVGTQRHGRSAHRHHLLLRLRKSSQNQIKIKFKLTNFDLKTNILTIFLPNNWKILTP